MTTALAPTSVTVRDADAHDVPWLLAELRAFTRFYGKEWLLPADDETAKSVIAYYVERGPFFVAEQDGSRVGLVAGVVGPHPFNPSVTVLSELAWWVTPSARGTSAGWRLFDAMIRHARLRAHQVSWSLLPHSPVDPSALEKRGFVLAETSYCLDLAAA